MKVDLDGRVKNLDLPVSKPLLPLLEAITNMVEVKPPDAESTSPHSATENI
jgi:hypothetical protein